MGAEDVSGTDGGLDALEKLAHDELERRLKDPEERAKLPGTGLLNLYLIFAKQKEPKKVEEEDVDLDVLEMIAATDLPADRKAELVEQERARLRERLEALEEL